MVSNPVTTDNLEARWRPLSEDENSVAQSLLDDAWAILNTLAPEVSGMVGTDPLGSVVISLVCAAAVRVLRNPEGNKSESIDDYSFTRDSSIAGGALYFTDAELELVRGIQPHARSYRFANRVCW